MAGVRGPHVENQPSKLLNDGENRKLFELLGHRSVTLSSAVVQVFWAEGPDYNRWKKRWCGVATFVKDNGKRSYYIRIFDLKNEKLLWEQELYSDFQYKEPRPYFHTFECDECPAGLNFANEDEAKSFREAVLDKIQIRQRRRDNTRKRAGNTAVVTNNPAPAAPSSPHIMLPVQMSTVTPVQMNIIPNVTTSTGTVNKKKDKSKKGKKQLTKSDIGAPSNFQHVSHVGWNAESGFDLETNPELRELFAKAGVSESQLQEDAEMSKFVRDFLDERGGLDAVKREREREKMRPPPAILPVSSLPPAQPPHLPPSPAVGHHGYGHSSRPPPPAVPPPVPAPDGRPPPPPGRPSGRAAPPPPPPNLPPSSRGLPRPPPPKTVVTSAAPKTVVASAAPPPPPPPGPPPPPPPGPPPPPAPSTNIVLPPAGSHPLPASEPDDGRNALLKDIQKGTQLKPVSSDDRPISKSSSSEEEGLAGALAKALLLRSAALKPDDSDSDEDEEDSDWED